MSGYIEIEDRRHGVCHMIDLSSVCALRKEGRGCTAYLLGGQVLNGLRGCDYDRISDAMRASCDDGADEITGFRTIKDGGDEE